MSARAGAALGLISTPSSSSYDSDSLNGFSPRSVESASTFSRSSQWSCTSDGPRLTTTQLLTSWLLHCIASAAVTTYDVLLRLVMPSWYLWDMCSYPNAAAYMHARAEKKTRRYVEAAAAKFQTALTAGQIILQHKPSLDDADFAFACSVFCGKHGKPWLLYAAWRSFMGLLAAAPGHTTFSTVTDAYTGAVLALFVDFRQGRAMHHFITALVDHEASKRHGIYVAKYQQLLDACTHDNIPLLRLGPTTDELKAGLGAVRLPVFVVGSPVWAHSAGRCSVVVFGIFTSVGVALYLWLTQWHMDAGGLGRLSTWEFSLLYTCCITFVKVLPLASIGWCKVLANPLKYLVQTSFYAQGVIFGGLLFTVIAAAIRQVSALALLDSICLFVMVGDCFGRLGCHFYGCCFGRQLQPAATAAAQASSSSRAPHRPMTSAARRAAPALSDPLGICDTVPIGVSISTARTNAIPSQQPAHKAVGTAAIDNVPYHPLAVVYIDRASSVLRMKPDLRLQPLLPTQLGQALYAMVVQVVLLAALSMHPQVKTGLVGCAVLAAYSVGRLLFFSLRQDECFKTNRSYTTAYIALGTLAACAPAAAYSIFCCSTSFSFNFARAPTMHEVLAYSCVAISTAAVNFIIQGLHHHEQVGCFPDLRALLAPPVKHRSQPATTSQTFGTTFSIKHVLLPEPWSSAVPGAVVKLIATNGPHSKTA